MRLRIPIVLLLAALLTLAPAAAARHRRRHAVQPEFTHPVRLAGATGGEPSIATDRLSDVFVVSPVGVPSGVGGTPGTALWVSRDDGRSFTRGRFIGSLLGGGDDGMIVPGGA